MIIIIGGGLAGLACAARLNEAGADWLLLEAKNKPGGRVATETTAEGYRLDAGFQVLLDSYPTARLLLDLPALRPCYFESGALLVNRRGEWERLLNPLSHPEWFMGAFFSRSFTWKEKFSLAAYTALQLLRSDQSLLEKEAGLSMMAELSRLHLDGGILEKFLRPFFAGVFLDNELTTDSSVFRYDLKKFVLGRALIPSGGMGEIPQQLAARLPNNRQRYGTPVNALCRSGNQLTGVELLHGGTIECSKLVLATDENTTRQFLGLPQGSAWLGVTTLYFIGEEALYEGALLVLPEGRERLVRHFVDLTNISPEYAPPGKRLLSATILKPVTEDQSSLVARVHREISAMFPKFSNWQFLQVIRIDHALPPRHPGYGRELLPERLTPDIFLAGDQITTPGIESALESGLRTAEELLGRA